MPAEVVEVPVAPPYPVIVGSGLDPAEAVAASAGAGPCAILTDSTVGPLHAEGLRRSLERAGWDVLGKIKVPAGEASKSLDAYAAAVGELARRGLTRDGTLFALGGGVVGDLGGFVAATFMRGIFLVMLPTSLLAMVDSAVGGKVGVDLAEGKNLVGAFFRPRAVVADLDWLGTLPPRELSNGLAEVVKMGLLSGGAFFEDLKRIPAAREGETGALRDLILHSVRFKAEVVAGDEREAGRRAILNYGHTLGHALESASGYSVPHGAAIAAGMMAAATLSDQRYGNDLLPLHHDLLHSAGLPDHLDGIDLDTAHAAMYRDKKRSAADGRDGHRFVLLEGIGRPVHDAPVTDGEARRALEAVVA